MKLQFRGNTYNQEPQTLDTPTTEVTGTFLGKTYKMRRSIVVKNTPQRNLTYRGVPY